MSIYSYAFVRLFIIKGTVVILTAFLLKMINDGLARTTSEDAGKLFLVKLGKNF